MVSRSSRDDKFIASATSAPKFLKLDMLKMAIKLWVKTEIQTKVPEVYAKFYYTTITEGTDGYKRVC